MRKEMQVMKDGEVAAVPETAVKKERRPASKHKWESVRVDANGLPAPFPSFSAAFNYMHEEFAEKDDGMHLVDKGSHTTNTDVVYKFQCGYYNYINCPFAVRIRVEVCHQAA